jgi:hypothetical protein
MTSIEWISTHLSHRHVLADDVACAVLRRLGGAATLIAHNVRSLRRLKDVDLSNNNNNINNINDDVVLLCLGDDALPIARAQQVLLVRTDRQAKEAKKSSIAISLGLIAASPGVESIAMWSLSADLGAIGHALAVQCGAATHVAAFGVGRNGKIAASYCARSHAKMFPGAGSQLGAAGVAVVFVARQLDLVPLCGAAGESLFDAILASPATVRINQVRIDDDDGNDDAGDRFFADDVLCSASLPFRTALVAGTQQAALECVQRALLDVLPPEHMATVSGALTLAKAKKAAQLLRETTHHVLRLELAFLLLALAPATKRIVRRRESALRVALALAVTDNFAAGVSHLEAQAAERAAGGGDGVDSWSDDELRALVRAFASALGQAPSADATKRMFGTDASNELHEELERIATTRATQLRRLGSILVQPGDANNEYVPFVRRLARQLFVERQVDEEQDCVHVKADDEVLGADYSALPAPPATHKPAAAKAFGLLGGAQKSRVSDFSTVYFVICGVASAAEVREVHEQVRASPLAKSLNVTVVSTMPSLVQ